MPGLIISREGWYLAQMVSLVFWFLTKVSDKPQVVKPQAD